MNPLQTNKNLTFANLVIVGYFTALYATYTYQIEHVFIGVLRELLTIPLFFAQFVFLGIGIHFLTKNKWKLPTVVSLLALAICTALTVGSFF